MKILIVSDYFQPKIGYTKVQVARHLMSLGHTVKILTSDRYFPFHNYETTTKKLIGKRIRSIGQKKENRFLVERKKILFEAFTRVVFTGIEESITEYKPNLVIVFGISTYTCYKVAKLKKKLNFKLIIADSHLPSELSSGNMYLKNTFYYIFRLLFSRVISEESDKVIAIQDKTKEVIRDIYGINKKINIVPNGTDINLFKFSNKERNNIRKELNISKDSFVIIYTGKVIKQKGLDILFKSFNSLINKKEIYLLIVGGGPKEYIDECYKIIDKDNHRLIKLVGFKDQKNLFKYYSASDLAVWPLQESLAMNDAAACSLPFIANSTMGDKTRLSNKNALLYKKGDADNLSKKIKIFIKNKRLRVKMGKNGRELMVKKLSWEKISKQYL
jgi:glycosyltransferase involved in cell wall biosynthesis